MMITTSMLVMNLAVGTITYDAGDGKVYGIGKVRGWRTCCDRRHIGQVTPSQRFFLQVREYLFNQVGNSQIIPNTSFDAEVPSVAFCYFLLHFVYHYNFLLMLWFCYCWCVLTKDVALSRPPTIYCSPRPDSVIRLGQSSDQNICKQHNTRQPSAFQYVCLSSWFFPCMAIF